MWIVQKGAAFPPLCAHTDSNTAETFLLYSDSNEYTLSFVFMVRFQ